MARVFGIIAAGAVAGVAIDLIAAYILLGCVDAPEWP